jgi:hypothetical protein
MTKVFIVFLLITLFLVFWNERIYKRILLSKAKNQETEFILGKPVVLMLESDYIELMGKIRGIKEIDDNKEQVDSNKSVPNSSTKESEKEKIPHL